MTVWGGILLGLVLGGTLVGVLWGVLGRGSPVAPKGLASTVKEQAGEIADQEVEVARKEGLANIEEAHNARPDPSLGPTLSERAGHKQVP